MKTILVKAFTREFPLVHLQMWGRRYEKEFLGEPMPQIPIYVFVLKDGLAVAYRNLDGQINSVHEIIRSKIEADKDYIDHLVLKDAASVDYLVKVNSQTSITSSEFVIYLDKLFDVWQLHYIAQFVPLDEKRFNAAVRAKALELRKTVDSKIIDCWDSLTPMLKKLYPKLGDLVVYISWDEIKNSTIPSQKELEKRDSEGILLFNGGVVSPEKLEKLKKQYDFRLEDNAVISGTKELKGQTACSGLVTGKVRIILRKEDVAYFLTGEILVSYMTMPIFISAMKKASAFITDEGGITCHAAILSREMQIPCVIGTKIATQVLKNGDLVEVDASKGVVKILKRV